MIIGISGYMGSGKDTVASMLQYLFNLSNPNLPLNPTYEDYVDAMDRMRKGIDLYQSIENPFEIKKFASAVKQIAAMMLNIDESNFESQEFKKSNLPECWDIDAKLHVIPGEIVESKKSMTYREFLQKLGTDAIRNQLHEDAWVNVLFAQYRALNPSKRIAASLDGFYDYTLCDFPNWIISDMRFLNEYRAVKNRKDGYVIRIERNIGDSYAPKHVSETALDYEDFDFHIENTGSLKELFEKVNAIQKQLRS